MKIHSVTTRQEDMMNNKSQCFNFVIM